MYHVGRTQEFEGRVGGMKIPIVIAAISTILLALALLFPLQPTLAQGISNDNPSPQPQSQSQLTQD